jgi:hypothetical protein
MRVTLLVIVSVSNETIVIVSPSNDPEPVEGLR